MARPEEKLHFTVCDYLKYAYPKAWFISEASGVRVSMGLASKLKRMRSAGTHLDLYILEPIGQYKGLFIELKAVNIYKKDGTLLKNEHVEDQAKTIEVLKTKGYAATFALGFDNSKKIIDSYMNGTYKQD